MYLSILVYLTSDVEFIAKLVQSCKSPPQVDPPCISRDSLFLATCPVDFLLFLSLKSDPAVTRNSELFRYNLYLVIQSTLQALRTDIQKHQDAISLLARRRHKWRSMRSTQTCIDNTNQLQIFEIQIGGIRQILEKSGHQFTFMNGKINAKVEEGKLYSLHTATTCMNHLLT